jgi:anti-sigma factor RsiW
MSCRRVSRELLERFRFGEELDSRSDPHLAHLQSCTVCREEVGLDHALVVQLRRALQARVAGHAPSDRSWEAVRARALVAEAGPTWSARGVRWARLLPAGAAMAVMVFAVATAGEADRQVALQQRSWPGELERASNDPEPRDAASEVPWWIRWKAAPPISLPATGAIAAVDPSEKLAVAPQPVSGLIR